MALVASRFNQVTRDLPPALIGMEGPGSAFRAAKGKGREGDDAQATKVVEWLSDWHLLAFLDSSGIFTPVRILNHLVEFLG